MTPSNFPYNLDFDFPRGYLKTLEIPALYMFYSYEDLYYIGQTSNLKTRLETHFTIGELKKYEWKHDINRLKYIVIENDIDRLLIESIMIATKHPQYNIAFNSASHNISSTININICDDEMQDKYFVAFKNLKYRDDNVLFHSDSNSIQLYNDELEKIVSNKRHIVIDIDKYFKIFRSNYYNTPVLTNIKDELIRIATLNDYIPMIPMSLDNHNYFIQKSVFYNEARRITNAPPDWFDKLFDKYNEQK